MTPEDKQYYDAMLTLTGTDEWQMFLTETVEPTLELMVQSAIDLKDERELYQRKGQVERLRWLARFREVIEAEMGAYDSV